MKLRSMRDRLQALQARDGLAPDLSIAFIASIFLFTSHALLYSRIDIVDPLLRFTAFLCASLAIISALRLLVGLLPAFLFFLATVWLCVLLTSAFALLWIVIVSGICAWLLWVAGAIRLPRLEEAAIAALLTIFVFSAKDIYGSPDVFDHLMAGQTNRDLIFHASIAAMIKVHGEASTGLHGLIPINYYVASHAFFAGISRLTRISTLEAYSISSISLSFVLPIYLLVSAARELVRADDGRANVFVYLTCLTFLFIYPAFAERWAIWPFFQSESYLLSLCVFVALVSFLLQGFDSPWGSFWTICATAAICTLKSSVALILCAMLLGRALLSVQVSRKRRWFEFAAAVAVSGLLIFNLAGSALEAGSVKIYFGHFVRSYSWGGANFSNFIDLANRGIISPVLAGWSALALMAFLIVHFLPAWTAIALGWRDRTDAKVLVLFGVLASIGVIAVFQMAGGAAFYFTNVTMFAGLVVVLQKIPSLIKFPRRGLIGTAACIALGAYQMLHIELPRAIQPTPEGRDFIRILRTAAAAHPETQVFAPSAGLLRLNPFSLCSTKPFVFVAATERLWVDVIQQDRQCNFEYYGYNSYKLEIGTNKVLVPPKLPEGASIITVD